MKEHFQWGDTDGNNGYTYYEFTPAELQAAWELQGTPFFDAFRAIPGQGQLEIHLGYESEPYIGFLQKKDAITIQAAIQTRAKYIEENEDIKAPTTDEIRARLQSRMKESKMTVEDLKTKIQAILDSK